jgi:hypothetical protein
MESVDGLERYNPPPLMCLLEEQQGGMGADEKVSISMIAICPSTGDVVWDEFEGKIHFYACLDSLILCDSRLAHAHRTRSKIFRHCNDFMGNSNDQSDCRQGWYTRNPLNCCSRRRI